MSLIPDIQQRLRDERDAEIQEAVDTERINSTAIAAIAMLDARLKDEVVARMLQKHWDLRLSEASEIIERAHSQLNKRVER